jgi:hypothetical protein
MYDVALFIEQMDSTCTASESKTMGNKLTTNEDSASTPHFGKNLFTFY